MSPTGVPARNKLLKLQKRLAEEARREIERSIDDPSGSLQRWRDTYEQATLGKLEPVSIEEIAKHALDCKVVHFGDYHSLRESQKGPLRVIEKLIEMGKKVVLCTEAFHIDAQDSLDRWNRNEIDDETLRSESNWNQRWGFPWRNYALQLDFFRERGLPILALNSEPDVVGNSFDAREKIAAMRLVEAINEHEDAVLAVTFGDLHVAPAHLPAQLMRVASRSGFGSPAQCTIFQNIDRVYWELAERGQEQKVQAVRIGEDRFCMVNTTPLVKFQSYLNWQFNEQELEESTGALNLPSISSTIMTDQIWMIIETIREYLGIPAEGFDHFTVHTGRDLDLIDRLKKQRNLDEAEMELVKAQLEREESCYLPRVQVIVLGNLSIRHASEEAAHHMNFVMCKDKGRVEDPIDWFYENALREAIGYLGTKIIDHKRTCLDVKELESLAERFRGRRMDPLMGATRQSVRDSLQHIYAEMDWLHGKGKRPTFRALAHRDPDVIAGTTHALGYRLGDNIYRNLVNGKLRRIQLKELFGTSLRDPGKSREVWFNWSRLAHDPESESSSSTGNSRRG